MDDFLRLPPEERRLYCEKVGGLLVVPPAVVEKDFWVCWTLRTLFALPRWGAHLTFKGGTSLSKCWALIERFSEDIDIVIGRDLLGFPADHSLTKRQVEKLRSACRTCVGGDLRAELDAAIRAALGEGAPPLDTDPDAPQEPTLLFRYPSEFRAPEQYLRPEVKIEFGARSDTSPAGARPVRTLLQQHLGEAMEQNTFDVRCLAPERTCLEKLMLIHELHVRPEGAPLRPRLARHYYDLWCMARAGVAARALADTMLVADVLDHRRVFFPARGVDYARLQRRDIRILPRDSDDNTWRDDYAAMRQFITESDPPTWDAIRAVMAELEQSLREAP